MGLYDYDNTLFVNLDLPASLDRETTINNILLRCGECPLIYSNVSMNKIAIGVWSKKWKPSIERMIVALDEEYNPLHNFDRYEKYDDERHNTDTNRTDGELNRTTSQNKTDTTTYNSDLESKTTYDTELQSKTTYDSELQSKTTYDSTITDGSTIDEDITYSGNDTTLNDVSAFNDSNYQPSSKNSLTSSNTSGRDFTEDKTTEHTGDDTRVDTHSGDDTRVDTHSGDDTRVDTHSGDDTRLDKHTGKDELKTVDAQTLKDVNAESKSGRSDETSKHDGHLYGNIGVTTSQQMLNAELDLRSKVNIYDVVAEMFYREHCQRPPRSFSLRDLPAAACGFPGRLFPWHGGGRGYCGGAIH
jgi:hypothetical protein